MSGSCKVELSSFGAGPGEDEGWSYAWAGRNGIGPLAEGRLKQAEAARLLKVSVRQAL
jgi:hypothetical protein